MSKAGYIVYIDEAGDFGLRSVAPLDPNGASEWMVLGAAVLRKENESSAPAWLKSMRDKANNTQPSSLHFRNLKDGQKEIACNELIKMPLRLFIIISNKQNMKGHTNTPASYISGHRHWFYWWMTRLLLERVTDFCAEMNERDGTPDKKLQIEFSRRTDLKRSHFSDYFTRLWAQGKDAHLAKRIINWNVFDFENVLFLDHGSRAGLQFADIATSAFYQAVNTHPHGICCPDYAVTLKPLVHKKQGAHLNGGFTVWPYSLKHTKLSETQKTFFRLYGLPQYRM